MIRLLVDENSFEEAMLKQLVDARAMLFKDLEKVKTDQKGMVFHRDYETDVREINKHLKAFEVVIRYYGGVL